MRIAWKSLHRPRTCLYDLGYDYDIADDGVQGLERFRAMAYAVALVDVVLPRMSGFELVRRAREARVLTPALSFCGVLCDHATAFENGFVQLSAMGDLWASVFPEVVHPLNVRGYNTGMIKTRLLDVGELSLKSILLIRMACL